LRRLGRELGADNVRQALAVWPVPTFLVPAEGDIDAGATSLVPQFLDCGARWLFGWFGPAGRAVAARVHFKFPRSFSEHTPVEIDAASRAAAREYLQSFVLAGGAVCR